MKKILLVFAFVFSAVMMFSFSAYAALDITVDEAKDLETVADISVCPAVGDCNVDGAVSVTDARSVLRYAVELEKVAASIVDRADIDQDGKITVNDARAVLRMAIGLDEPCGHNTEELVLIPATCSTEGYSIKYCKACLKKYSEVKGFDNSVHLGGWETVTPATCQGEGYKQYKCQLCDTVIKDKVTEKTGHQYESWVYPDGKDCLNPVERYRVCKYCGYRQDDVLNPRGAHDFYWVHTVPATCTEEGLDEYKCAYCDEVIKTEVKKATGHLYNSVNMTEYQKATCTESGLKAHICVNCGEPREGTITVVPALGHVYDYSAYKVVTEPTCAEEGLATTSCKVCGDDIEFALDKLDHTYVEDWTVTTPAACETEGTRRCVCKYCGEVTEVIPATGHKGATTVTKKASCTETGIRTVVCDVCGKSVEEEIPMTDHIYKNAYDRVIVEPSCTYKGKAVKICSACGHEEEVTLKTYAANHKAVETVVTEATCTENRVSDCVCEYCGISIGRKEIPDSALGHTDGEWVVLAEATCTEDGEKELHCSVCDEIIETAVIPATGHSESSEKVIRAATCTTAGEKEISCAVCGVPFRIETIPAIGHANTDETIVLSPDGTVTRTVKCNDCGETVETETFTKFAVFCNGTVNFEETSSFEAGSVITFTITADDAVTSVRYSCDGSDDTGVEIIPEDGKYSFAIPEGVADDGVITIYVFTEY